MAENANVVLIVMDDMREDDLRALKKTREELGEVTTFPNHFNTSPVCSPSRSSILTGQYTHNHGVTDISGEDGGWNGMMKHGVEEKAFVNDLQQAGVHTGMVGKYNNKYRETTHVPPGWDYWVALEDEPFGGNKYIYRRFWLSENGRRRKYRDNYLTNILTQKANAFLRTTPGPFFLQVCPFAPHSPSTPPERYADDYKDMPLSRPPNFQPNDLSDKPAYIRNHTLRPHRTPLELRDMDRNRMRSMKAVDDLISSMAKTLKSNGLFNNTYWIIVTDNGYLLGEHDYYGKSVPYDKSVRCPLLLAGPGVTQGTNPKMTANIDLAKTISNMLGVEFDGGDGIDFLSEERDAILLEQMTGKLNYQAVRTNRYLYVEYNTGERELYDYQEDPYELDNQLANWQGHTPSADPGVVSELQDKLDSLLA